MNYRNNNYRATLCISAVLAVAVRLSMTCVLYPNGWRYHQIFSRPGSPIILLFEPKRRYAIPRETLLTWEGVR